MNIRIAMTILLATCPFATALADTKVPYRILSVSPTLVAISTRDNSMAKSSTNGMRDKLGRIRLFLNDLIRS
jgi:hypothetical protein